jgi:hypothetical protein
MTAALPLRDWRVLSEDGRAAVRALAETVAEAGAILDRADVALRLAKAARLTTHERRLITGWRRRGFDDVTIAKWLRRQPSTVAAWRPDHRGRMR